MGVECYENDALYHHGIAGQKWGQRNGPPYPLQPHQTRLSGPIQKGKQILGDAASYTAKRVHEKLQADAEASRARRVEMAGRKSSAKERARLIKMAKKHPEWLSDKELKDLNSRASDERSFDKLYKTQGETKNALVKDVVNPTAVAIGKAAVVSIFTGDDFGELTKSYVKDAIGKKKDGGGNNNNQNQNNSQNQGGGKKNKNKNNNSGSGNSYSLFTINRTRNRRVYNNTSSGDSSGGSSGGSP